LRSITMPSRRRRREGIVIERKVVESLQAL